MTPHALLGQMAYCRHSPAERRRRSRYRTPSSFESQEQQLFGCTTQTKLGYWDEEWALLGAQSTACTPRPALQCECGTAAGRLRRTSLALVPPEELTQSRRPRVGKSRSPRQTDCKRAQAPHLKTAAESSGPATGPAKCEPQSTHLPTCRRRRTRMKPRRAILERRLKRTSAFTQHVDVQSAFVTF